MSMRFRVTQRAPEVVEYDLDFDGCLDVDEEQSVWTTIDDDICDQLNAGFLYCRVNDSDRFWNIEDEDARDDVLKTAWRLLQKKTTVKINYFSDDPLEESFRRKRRNSRFLMMREAEEENEAKKVLNYLGSSVSSLGELEKILKDYVTAYKDVEEYDDPHEINWLELPSFCRKYPRIFYALAGEDVKGLTEKIRGYLQRRADSIAMRYMFF